MMKYERVPYQKIKFSALDAYYDFCRDRAVGMGWSHEQILGSVDYEYENVYELPIEKLMLRIVLLVLSGGWHKDVEQNIRQRVTDSFIHNGLEKLLEGIPSDEAEEFCRDLAALKLIHASLQETPSK